MKKRVLMSLVVLAIVGTSAVFAQQPTLDKLSFQFQGGGGQYFVREANKNISGEVVIPSTYNGKPSDTIPSTGFDDCTAITSVIILDGVKVIGGSFRRCTSLKSVIIPASVGRIERLVFDGCTNLTSITFGGSNISLQGAGANSLPGDLDAKYKAGGAGTYTREAGGKTWTKQGGFSLNGTWTRSDGMKITITENGQNITITGDKPNNGGKLNDTYTKR